MREFFVTGGNTFVNFDTLEEVLDFVPLTIKYPVIPSRSATP
jgi:hypothetical protein